MALKDDVLAAVKRLPDRSASQIANVLGAKSPAVASVLIRLTEAGVLTRTTGKGPRGGWGYRVLQTGDALPPSNKTAWQHLQDEDGL